MTGNFIRDASRRLGLHWRAKALGLTLGMTGFFSAYFLLLNHPVFPVTIMPLTAFDRLVGLQPAALPLYFSLWIYVSLLFGLLKNKAELLSGGAAALALSVTGLGIFWALPTVVPARGFDGAGHPVFAFLKTVDASGNACPSLHVAFAVFTAIRLGRVFREMKAALAIRLANALWAVGIVYSTLATGQHVVLDALAGALLGALMTLPRFAIFYRREKAGASSA